MCVPAFTEVRRPPTRPCMASARPRPAHRRLHAPPSRSTLAAARCGSRRSDATSCGPNARPAPAGSPTGRHRAAHSGRPRSASAQTGIDQVLAEVGATSKGLGAAASQHFCAAAYAASHQGIRGQNAASRIGSIVSTDLDVADRCTSAGAPSQGALYLTRNAVLHQKLAATPLAQLCGLMGLVGLAAQVSMPSDHSDSQTSTPQPVRHNYPSNLPCPLQRRKSAGSSTKRHPEPQHGTKHFALQAVYARHQLRRNAPPNATKVKDHMWDAIGAFDLMLDGFGHIWRLRPILGGCDQSVDGLCQTLCWFNPLCWAPRTHQGGRACWVTSRQMPEHRNAQVTTRFPPAFGPSTKAWRRWSSQKPVPMHKLDSHVGRMLKRRRYACPGLRQVSAHVCGGTPGLSISALIMRWYINHLRIRI